MIRKHIKLIIIITLSLILTFYRLGSNPPSLDWDEASIGYNAYSILKTGRDEYGNFLPINIRSFNDYKPPAYVYLSLPSIAAFGLNEFAVRLPSAVAGVVTVIIIYLLVGELFPAGKQLNLYFFRLKFSEIAALMLAVSPWHLQFSRVAFEANLSLAFFVLGVYFLVKSGKTRKLSWFLGSGLWLTASLYAYHSARVTVPLFLAGFFLFMQKQFSFKKRTLVFGFFLISILSLPLLFGIFQGSVQARFSTVSVFSNPGIFTPEAEKITRQKTYALSDSDWLSLFHRRWPVLVKIVMEGYFDHFNPNFLFIEGDGIGRHSASGMGLLYLWQLPFLIAGFYYLLKNRPKYSNLLYIWLAAAPAASALTTQTPHAVRSLLLNPALIIITAYGIINLLSAVNRKTLSLFFLVIAVFNLFFYLDLYYLQTPSERSKDWQYGYRQLVEKVSELEADYKEVIITTEYDQPYIYFLFYNRIDPAWYQTAVSQGSAGFSRYFFRKIDYNKEKEYPNHLLIGAPSEIPQNAPVIDKIYFINQQEAYIIVQT